MATPHNKVAAQLSHLMFLGTEFAIESHAGAGIPAMTHGLVNRIVPRTWPQATPEQLQRIAIHFPILNYARDDRKAVTQRVADLLRETFPPAKAKRPAPKRKKR